MRVTLVKAKRADWRFRHNVSVPQTPGQGMSVRVQTYVWQLELKPIEKLVAIALADHCRDDGTEGRPSQRLLCEKTGLSERSVRDTLHELVRLHVLMVQRKSGQHRPNCYMFPIPEGFGKLRPAPPAPLSPEGQSTSQRGNLRLPEGHSLPPNHKEPSYETESDFQEIVDLDAVRRKNREIFKSLRPVADSSDT